MDYSNLIRDAWAITWRYRFLWVIGLFAGGGAVMLPGGPSGRSGRSPGAFNPEEVTSQLGLLIALAVVAAVAIVALCVVSLIARGAMARATSDLAIGRTTSPASAWSAGKRLFWRYLGLWALVIGAGLAVVAVIGAIVATVLVAHAPVIAVFIAAAALAAFVGIVLRLTREFDTPQWKVVLAALLLALPVFPVLVVMALGASIVLAFAQRAIAVEDVGPIDALRSGWRLMRAHLGESLMTWLINAALATASGIVSIGAALGTVVVLGGVGFMLFAAVGFSVPLFAYAGAGALLVLVAFLTVLGITNTFFWSYWTLVYLRLSGRALV